MTKSNTIPSLEQRFAAAEEAHAKAVADAKVKAEELSSQLVGAREAVESADERVIEVERAIRQGDPSFDAEALGAARLDAEAAQIRRDALEVELRRAKAPRSTEIEGALGLLPAVKQALPGVPVYVTAADLPELTEADAPLVVLRQLQNTVARDGSLSRPRRQVGVEVELHYLRSIVHRELDRPRLSDTFRSLGIKAELTIGCRYRKIGANADLDLLTLRSGEPSTVPVVEQVATDAPGISAAGGFLQRLGLSVAGTVSGLLHESTDLDTIKSNVIDGVRTTTVSGVTRLRQPERPGPGAEAASGRLDNHVGEFVAGLGRVVSVAVDRAAHDVRPWSVAFTSRTSHDVPLEG